MTSAAGPERRRLVLIIGPIASGKSTLAGEVADQLRAAGEAVAVVGLDTIAEMALPTLPDWAWAHDIHGQVVAAWLATPIPTVIAEGPASQTEVEELLRHVPEDVAARRVLLVSSYGVALERATADPTRGISKDPEFLAGVYRQFATDRSRIAHDLRLDSGAAPPGVLAARVVDLLRRAR